MFHLISTPEALPPSLATSLSSEEKEWMKKLSLPFSVTRHYASLAGPGKSDPLRRQFIPDPLEARNDPFALDDPLGEAHHRVTPRLVHQYKDRVLLLAGGNCAGFCRYCFRRVRMSSLAAFINREELEPVLAYIKSRPVIREIIISGGDPLSAEDGELLELFTGLREARPDLQIRVGSRIPITCPERIKRDTVTLFARFKPIRLVVHINHKRELAPVCRAALASVVEAGIPVLVQTVLLRGINDNAETLAALFRECLELGLKPYYLFQLDLAPGTAHFRVPLKEGLFIYEALQRLIDNPPSYVVDLPGGGGKIRLSGDIIAGEEERPGGKVYLLKDISGKLWEYPIF